MLPRQIPERATRNVQQDLQLALIELPAHVDAATPRCVRCDWPAAKRPKVAGYSDFCGGRRCKNPARACRLCAKGCEICGIDLLVKVKTKAFTRVRMVVDHDHNCCPGTVSACGRCVRGLICVTCNAAIGLLRDSPATARSAAAYLDAWQAR